MNDTPNTANNGIEIVRHFYVDADGNEVEIPFDAGAGETSPAETTVYTTAEDGDHEVTVTVH